MKLQLVLASSPSYPHILLPTLPSLISAKPIRSFAGCPRGFLAKCSSKEGGSDSVRDLLSGMVDERVEELLNRGENKVLLDGLKKASLRVEAARKELESIKRQGIEAAQMKDYLRKLESRAYEIAECKKELLEARTMVEEAELSLSRNLEGVSLVNDSVENETQEMNRGLERVESIKAAAISALVGTLAGVPVSLSQATSCAQLVLHLAIIFISCTLFGVTFRYTMRRDLDDIQLKTGAPTAFAFIKGLAEMEMGQPFEFTGSSILSHAADGAIHKNDFEVKFRTMRRSSGDCLRLLKPDIHNRNPNTICIKQLLMDVLEAVKIPSYVLEDAWDLNQVIALVYFFLSFFIFLTIFVLVPIHQKSRNGIGVLEHVLFKWHFGKHAQALLYLVHVTFDLKVLILA